MSTLSVKQDESEEKYVSRVKRAKSTGKITRILKSENKRNLFPGSFTFDKPVTGGTPAGADAKVTDPEWFWIGVAQKRSQVVFLAHRKNPVIPPASFA